MPIHQLCEAMQRYPFFADMFGGQRNSPADLIAQLANLDEDHLTREQLVEAVRVKNASGPGASIIVTNAGANSELDIINATRAAFATNDAADAIRPLITLRGVGVATASAILSWRHPDRWPVIDRRALATLSTFELINRESPDHVPREIEWPPFVKVIRDLERELKWHPQRIDRWLYAFDKTELSKDCLN